MKERAVEIVKLSTVSVLTLGLVFCSIRARAEEPVQHVAVLETPKPRVVAAPVMTIGGLRPGQVMVIGAGTSEVMSATDFAQRPIVTPVMKAAQACFLK